MQKIVWVRPRDGCFHKFYFQLLKGGDGFIYFRYIKVLLTINQTLNLLELTNSKLNKLFSPKIFLSLESIKDHQQGED